MFADRADAGRRFGARWNSLSLNRPIVFALTRGGVAVAAEIAAALPARSTSSWCASPAPGQPELALAAVVAGHAKAETVLNADVVELTIGIAVARPRGVRHVERDHPTARRPARTTTAAAPPRRSRAPRPRRRRRG